MSGQECPVASSFFLFLGRVSASPGDAPFVLCFGCGVLKGGSSEDGLLAYALPSFVCSLTRSRLLWIGLRVLRIGLRVLWIGHNVIYFSNSELIPSSIALLAGSTATYG